MNFAGLISASIVSDSYFPFAKPLKIGSGVCSKERIILLVLLQWFDALCFAVLASLINAWTVLAVRTLLLLLFKSCFTLNVGLLLHAVFRTGIIYTVDWERVSSCAYPMLAYGVVCERNGFKSQLESSYAVHPLSSLFSGVWTLCVCVCVFVCVCLILWYSDIWYE